MKLRKLSVGYYFNTIKSKMLILLFMMAFGIAKSQDRIELGVMAGASYYIGDLNPQKQFYKPGFSYGGIARYVLTDRFALKGTASMVRIKGSYPDNDVLFPEGEQTYSFNRAMGDAALQMEFNFTSYDHPFIGTTNFTPFISFGLGTTIYKRFSTDIENNSEQTVFILSLPIGVGFKYKVNKWVRVGAEWSFRKTFVDDLDYVGNNLPVNPDDPYGFYQETTLHNNDWYSFAGVSITVSMFRRKTECNSGY
ncbi:DUF6089 family protein [Plebeiibacterium marinum]|nr:DUF6089 family protein [Plebeiobacterium marinum]